MMKTPIRAAIGIGVGFVLAAIAFVTWNLGHGTFTPLIANVSFLAYIPIIGVVIAFFGPPFLWASYFIFIPKIHSRMTRSAVLVLLVLLHFIPVLWAGSRDYTFTRAVQIHLEGLLAHGLFLAAAITYLAFLSSNVAGRPDSQQVSYRPPQSNPTLQNVSPASVGSWKKAIVITLFAVFMYVVLTIVLNYWVSNN
jgi:hypothetical protein